MAVFLDILLTELIHRNYVLYRKVTSSVKLHILSHILRYPYYLFRPVYERTSFHRKVIDELPDPEMQHAYNACRLITRQYAKTFYMSTRFLPTSKQRNIFAIYSLCRCLDNLVDELKDENGKNVNMTGVAGRINQWKSDLEMVYDNRYYGDNLVLKAFSDTLETQKISIELPFLLIEGVVADLKKNRYANFGELYDYSYKVASVVGLMIAEVFGYSDKNALKYAADLGIAMQLTNILRDVGEDLQRDRIYLPQDEMAQFGVTESDLLAHKLTDNFIRLMQFQIRRAHDYYQRAEPGIMMLNADSRLPVYLAHQNYSAILNRIAENGYDVFNRRAYLSKSEKLAKLPRTWWLSRNSKSAF